MRSYRTVSPLPVGLAPPSAVFSLLHFPAGHPVWQLASTLPYGAPTFLDVVEATPRPPGRLTVDWIVPRPAGSIRRDVEAIRY